MITIIAERISARDNLYRYTVPYDGLYQFTVAFQAHGDKNPMFYLEVDDVLVAFIGNNDDINGYNSVIMTRNLHLAAGQRVTLDLQYMDGVWGNDGFESWFSGHLIYSDVL